MKKIIEVENLYKAFGRKKVLTNISFSIEAGRIIGLLGENGVGKTTLLKVLADLYKPDKGHIWIIEEESSIKTHKYISYMIHTEQLSDWMTIQQAIYYFKDLFPDFDTKKAFLLCDIFQLSPKDKVKRLSKGNQERVMLLLTISREAYLYILDEPLEGLDIRMKKSMIEILISNIKEDASILISTHMVREMEEIFDEVMVLHNNQLIAANADDIREQKQQSIEEFYLEVTKNA
ncbi:ABC transporter [Anaerocolumna cellulosilytica]|uniref:ABC transporter n=1 Tax=Anaerocolumna cellulosilytica TaxID=433286 RepID=A0A6S6RA85_9FIRM|nr:ABC transporter ATP-binding protein [Anaerocolumna cellulosilytica]MBB5195492.1 ABC-2 type transport system ATP-binding protein [Anaerocolumna cellulosilytica]BCJ96025.1 ABC transporter [Anaerocolumna cellulosilytica]